ncbi:AAA family ATPase [Myroides sp. DW712]|uniref:AAA family ATPase n=1 Tax=Myroides sp. DW712 TaxID=3389800 RepID=UPI00397D934E
MYPYYILTGGPGSGKSTVLEALAQLGYAVVPEVGRAIIQQQMKIQGAALPWEDKQQFFEHMFDASLIDYRQQSKQLTFFDRGLLDSVGYATLEHLRISAKQYEIAQHTPYAKTVLIFPPWQTIYQKDTERKQDFALAVRTYETMRTTYESFGYQLVVVPCTTVEKRVEFILNYLRLLP